MEPRKNYYQAGGCIRFWAKGQLSLHSHPATSECGNEIPTLLGKMDFVAGVSDSFCGLSELKEYYQEARAAIKFASPDASRVRTFSDCWGNYVLPNCTGGLPAKRLFPPGLVWLEEGRNDSLAAARLFISRNSFLQNEKAAYARLFHGFILEAGQSKVLVVKPKLVPPRNM